MGHLNNFYYFLFSCMFRYSMFHLLLALLALFSTTTSSAIGTSYQANTTLTYVFHSNTGQTVHAGIDLFCSNTVQKSIPVTVSVLLQNDRRIRIRQDMELYATASASGGGVSMGVPSPCVSSISGANLPYWLQPLVFPTPGNNSTQIVDGTARCSCVDDRMSDATNCSIPPKNCNPTDKSMIFNTTRFCTILCQTTGPS